MENPKPSKKICDTSQKAHTTLYLIFYVLAIESLLHCVCFPFVVAKETEKPSSSLGLNSTPRIQLEFAPRGGAKTVYEAHSVVLTETHNFMEILCTASYPIQWKMSSSIAPLHVSVNAYRSAPKISQVPGNTTEHGNHDNENEKIPLSPENAENGKRIAVQVKNRTRALRIFNTRDFLYHLRIGVGIVTDVGLFGYVGSCQSIGHESKTTAIVTHGNEQKSSLLEQKVDVFMPGPNRIPYRESSKVKYFCGERKRFKIVNRRRTQTAKGDPDDTKTGFVIPCPLINATLLMAEPETLNVTLVQIFNEGQENETRLELDLVQGDYDPNSGFYLRGWEELEGVFVCLAQSTVETVEGGSGFKAQSENVTFEFVKSQGEYLNPGQEDWLDVTNETNRTFPRRKNNDTRIRLEISYKFGFAACYSNYEGFQYELSWTQCDTYVLCEAMKICFFQYCGPFVTVKKAASAWPVSMLSTRTVNGIYRCSAGGDEVYAYSFRGLDNNQCYNYITTRPYDQIPPMSALIQFRMTNKTESQTQGLDLYTNEWHSFECTALKFLFTEELVVLAQYANGTKAYFSEGTIKMTSKRDSSNIVAQVNVEVTSDMVGIWCLAPWSNSADWAEANISFSTNDVSPPKVVAQNQGEQVFCVGDTERSLSCEAKGAPKPNFKWTTIKANGNETDIRQGYFAIQFLEGGTILQFPKIDKSHSGIYVCEATNKFGTDRQAFHVNVQEVCLSTGVIVGIAVGCVFFLVTLIFVLYKYFQTRKKLRNLTDDEVDEFKNGNPDALKNTAVQGENAHLLPFNRDFEVPASEFSVDQGKILGSGEFGVVYGGKFREREVAIKTTKATTDVDFFKSFLKEIKVMIFIGQHQNVVQLLGTSTNKIRERVVFVIVELGVHGDLDSFLMEHKANFVATLSSSQLFNIGPEKLISVDCENVESIIKITTLDLIKWCGQIAVGMAHLASKKIINGNLAPRNILLFDDFTAKITDFGISRQLYLDVYSKQGMSPLPWRLMAPESLKYLQFSVKSDVWAFGVLVWEIFSLGTVPYSGLSWTQEFLDNLERGLRVQKPNHASSEIYENMCDCWNFQPEDRPEFEQLENFYNDILRGNAPETMCLTLE